MNIKDYIRLLRPKQWTKNFFVMLPLFFGGRLFDEQAFIDAALLRRHAGELLIIPRNPQLLGEQNPDAPSPAAVLAFNCNDKIFFHSLLPADLLCFWRKIRSSYPKFYSPRYAFLIRGSVRRSFACPSMRISPVSNT